MLFPVLLYVKLRRNRHKLFRERLQGTAAVSRARARAVRRATQCCLCLLVDRCNGAARGRPRLVRVRSVSHTAAYGELYEHAIETFVLLYFPMIILLLLVFAIVEVTTLRVPLVQLVVEVALLLVFVLVHVIKRPLLVRMRDTAATSL